MGEFTPAKECIDADFVEKPTKNYPVSPAKREKPNPQPINPPLSSTPPEHPPSTSVDELPEKLNYFLSLAVTAHKLGHFNFSIMLCRIFLVFNSADYWGLCWLAISLYRSKCNNASKKAHQLLCRAIAVNFNHPLGHYLLGTIHKENLREYFPHYADSRFISAFDCELSAEQYMNTFQPMGSLCDMHYGNRNVAIIELTTAYNMVSDSTDRLKCLYAIADVQCAGTAKRAIKTYEMILELYPDEQMAHYHLFRCYASLNKYTPAMKEYKYLKEHAPKMAEELSDELNNLVNSVYLTRHLHHLRQIEAYIRKQEQSLIELSARRLLHSLHSSQKLSEQETSDGYEKLVDVCRDDEIKPQDFSESVKWAHKSAEKGNADGQGVLGMALYIGKGVPQDYAESLKWLRMSAAQGDSNGQYFLGLAYYNGNGVQQSYAEAFNWFHKSAENGNDIGQYMLGLAYLWEHGVPQNSSEAMTWFRKSAEQGNAGAQYMLGNSYRCGNGVPKDYIEAYKWLNLAADGESSLATLHVEIKEVMATMTPAQLTEGQRRAAEFKLKEASP